MRLSKLRAAHEARRLAGTTIPRQGAPSSSSGLRNCGYASGGRIKRGDGGEVDDSPANPGEVSDAESAKYLRAKSEDKLGSGLLKAVGSSALIGSGIGSARGSKDIPQAGGKKFAKGLGATLVGIGAPMVKTAYDHLREGFQADTEARKFDSKKSGGRIKPGFIKKPGALRGALGAKPGEKIPAKKLEKATHSDNPTLRKRAVLAKTMRGWKKG